MSEVLLLKNRLLFCENLQIDRFVEECRANKRCGGGVNHILFPSSSL